MEKDNETAAGPVLKPYPGVAGEKRLQQAADEGDVEAQFQVGIRYFTGKGGVIDHKIASKYLTLAAQQHHTEAQFQLGNLLLKKGYNLAFNPKQAAEWYLKATEKVHPGAQAGLARLYLEGIGVKQNRRLAKHWAEQALENGHTPAEAVLTQLRAYWSRIRTMVLLIEGVVSIVWMILYLWHVAPEVSNLQAMHTWFARRKTRMFIEFMFLPPFALFSITLWLWGFRLVRKHHTD